jgi:hypothetical protein
MANPIGSQTTDTRCANCPKLIHLTERGGTVGKKNTGFCGAYLVSLIFDHGQYLRFKFCRKEFPLDAITKYRSNNRGTKTA